MGAFFQVQALMTPVRENLLELFCIWKYVVNGERTWDYRVNDILLFVTGTSEYLRMIYVSREVGEWQFFLLLSTC